MSQDAQKLVIIGSGPAGYTAGVYAARAQLATLLYAGYKAGGQLMWTTDIENFPGFPNGKDGQTLMAEMRQQAERFGTTVLDKYVTAIDFSARPFKLWTNLPDTFDPETHQFDSPAEFERLMAQIKSEPPVATAEAGRGLRDCPERQQGSRSCRFAAPANRAVIHPAPNRPGRQTPCAKPATLRAAGCG